MKISSKWIDPTHETQISQLSKRHICTLTHLNPDPGSLNIKEASLRIGYRDRSSRLAPLLQNTAAKLSLQTLSGSNIWDMVQS